MVSRPPFMPTSASSFRTGERTLSSRTCTVSMSVTALAYRLDLSACPRPSSSSSDTSVLQVRSCRQLTCTQLGCCWRICATKPLTCNQTGLAMAVQKLAYRCASRISQDPFRARRTFDRRVTNLPKSNPNFPAAYRTSCCRKNDLTKAGNF